MGRDPAGTRLVTLAGAATCVAALLAVAFGLLLSRTIAAVFPSSASAEGVPGLLVALALIAVLRGVALAAVDILAQRGSSRIRGRLRRDLTGHVAALGPLWAARERTGELVAVLTAGLDAIDAWLTSYRPARVAAGVVPLLVLLVVLLLDPLSGLVLVLTGPMLLLLLAVIGGRARAVTEQRFRELRWLGAFFLDMVQGLTTLKLFGRSREQVATIREVSRRYADTTMEVLRTAFQTALVLEWAATVATAVVAVEVGLRLIDGAIGFERALAVIVITPEFFLPLRQLSLRYHAGSAGRTAAERIASILDEPLPQDPAPDRPAGPPETPQAMPASASRRVGRLGDIRLEGVRFAYPGRPEALRGLDLVLAEGTSLALVGRTGSGKTTVANLLLRFAEPTAGEVTVGGRALASLPRDAWLADVAWVPQRPHLFDGTVADNLRLGRPGATDADLRRAARLAGADGFIERLPSGYETRVGERGSRLSGGQRQRLAIARAWLRDARLVILDEATAHLDAASEERVRAAATALLQGRSGLIISHRHRLAAIADRVAVLDAGRVLRVGRPDELLHGLTDDEAPPAQPASSAVATA